MAFLYGCPIQSKGKVIMTHEDKFSDQQQASLTDNPDLMRELISSIPQRFLEAEFTVFRDAEPKSELSPAGATVTIPEIRAIDS